MSLDEQPFLPEHVKLQIVRLINKLESWGTPGWLNIHLFYGQLLLIGLLTQISTVGCWKSRMIYILNLINFSRIIGFIPLPKCSSPKCENMLLEGRFLSLIFHSRMP